MSGTGTATSADKATSGATATKDKVADQTTGTGGKSADTGTADKGGKAAATDGKTADKATGTGAGKGTILDAIDTTTTDDDAGGKAPPTWPDDWRDQIAGGDDKSMALLKRYSSPAAVFNALRAAQAKISSGEYKKGLGKDATPEEVAAYRKEAGIPEKPEGYELPKGLEISEIDKPIVDGFLTFAHEQNYSPAQVQGVVDWWYRAQGEQAAQAHEADTQFTQENDDLLRKEWGNEYRGNLNGLRNWLTKDAPEGVMENLFGGRLANGRPVGSDATTLNWLVSLMKEVNPAATVTTNGEYQGGKGLLDRKAEIEKMMRTDRKSYDKDPNIKKEYLGILETLEKIDKRKAA